MAVGVLMPKEGITVESCIMGAWKKKVGDTVKTGDPLFSYETDKAEFEAVSTADGKILAIFYEEGDEVPCLVNVCAVGNDGDEFASLDPRGGAAAEAPADKPADTPAPAKEEAAPAKADTTSAQDAPAAAKSEDGIHISPRARRLAENANVDASKATPTGPRGRIIERDVRKLMEEGVPAQAAAPAATPAAAPAACENEYEDVKFSAVRKATAKAMLHSLQSTAQLTLNTSFDASQLLSYRASCKALEDTPVAKISLNDMVMFAVSRTLKDFPEFNANMIDDTTVRQFRHVNLGFACDAPKGLFVPVVKNACCKSLLAISQDCKKLAGDARDGKLAPDDMTGGTFTISNVGAFGIESFTPVINPPQVAILGVAGIETKIKSAADGKIETYPAMGLSLTIDHRVIDGAPGARFLKVLCSNLENFVTLLAQ